MNQLLTEPAPANVRRIAPIARALVIGLVGAALLAFGFWLVRSPDLVHRVVVVNQTGYDLDVDVTGAGRDGWLPLNVAIRDTTTTTDDVVDQGSTWIFRFTHAGVVAGEMRVARDDLSRDNWRVEVPEEIAERLQLAGAVSEPAP